VTARFASMYMHLARHRNQQYGLVRLYITFALLYFRETLCSSSWVHCDLLLCSSIFCHVLTLCSFGVAHTI
jgi:hypothetical protein